MAPRYSAYPSSTASIFLELKRHIHNPKIAKGMPAIARITVIVKMMPETIKMTDRIFRFLFVLCQC